MPVSITVASHSAEPFHGPKVPSRSALLASSCASTYASEPIIESSLPKSLFDEKFIKASSNGFVHTCITAYSRHHHLVIRPDDIWTCMLSQLNFYINAHAEELRHVFVSHEGKKRLELEDFSTDGVRDWDIFARRMTGLIQENVKDPDLKDWMMPAFSTTTVNDRTVASILMMGSLQAYFEYFDSVCCGIPSVTLLGTRDDWVDLVGKLDKLKELGEEAALWGRVLKPILERFVKTFDEGQAPENRDFWGQMVEEDEGSGFHYISGWLTAFCFWRNDGVCIYRQREEHNKRLEERGYGGRDIMELDQIKYYSLDFNDVPNGYASVPVTFDDDGVISEKRMVAGLLAFEVKDIEDVIANEVHTDEKKLDTLQPMAGWFVYDAGVIENYQKPVHRDIVMS